MFSWSRAVKQVDKKGVELSINFIVIIVISIIVFFFGARFIYKLASEATEIQQLTADELDERIGSLLCEGSQKVCLGIDRKLIKRGELGIFGLKIINIGLSQNFEIKVSESGAYTKKGAQIANNLLYLPKDPRTVYIQRNDDAQIGIGIEVPKNTQAGTYIFNAVVCFDDRVQGNDDSTGKCAKKQPFYRFVERQRG